MRKSLFLLAIALFLRAVEFVPQTNASPTVLSESAIEKIEDPRTSELDFISALKNLPDVKALHESPEFWRKIANSPIYSNPSRRRAVLQLFSRHFRPGMTLEEVSELIGHPNWVKKEQLFDYLLLGGPRPFLENYQEGDGIFAIGILNDEQYGDYSVLDFRIQPRVYNMKDLFDGLQGQFKNESLKNAKVLEIRSFEYWQKFFLQDKFGVIPKEILEKAKQKRLLKEKK